MHNDNTKKILYSELKYPIKDYFATVSKQEIIFDLIIPIIVGVIASYLIFDNINDANISNFIGFIINSSAILIGFTLTCIAVLISSNNKNIELIKETKTTRKIGKKVIKLYQLLLVGFEYTLITEIVILLYNLAFMIIMSSSTVCVNKYLFFIDIVFVLHIIALNLRNSTNLYLVHFKDEKNDELI